MLRICAYSTYLELLCYVSYLFKRPIPILPILSAILPILTSYYATYSTYSELHYAFVAPVFSAMLYLCGTALVNWSNFSNRHWIVLFSGFMSTGDHNAPGNYALMDIVAALQWLKENIGSFGGDPDNISLMGQGSGAALVNLLMVSPVTIGEKNISNIRPYR